MRILKILLIIGIAAYGYRFWDERQQTRQLEALARESPNGFIPVTVPDAARAGSVVIYAPLNCPSHEARRADALADELGRLGIPVVRSSSFSLALNNPSKAEMASIERTTAIIQAAAPAVFLKGMGKSNPSLDEVVAEYRRLD